MFGKTALENMPCSVWIPILIKIQAGSMKYCQFKKPGEHELLNWLYKMDERLKNKRSLNNTPRVKCGRISAYSPTVFNLAFL